MKKNVRNKFKFSMITKMLIFLMFLSPFGAAKVYGFKNHTEDEGPDVSDESISWSMTYYNDGNRRVRIYKSSY